MIVLQRIKLKSNKINGIGMLISKVIDYIICNVPDWNWYVNYNLMIKKFKIIRSRNPGSVIKTVHV